MPAKMMSEMPLPMPRSVICSPSHMRNAVPVVRESTVIRRNVQPGSDTTSPTDPPSPAVAVPLRPSSQYAMPMPWMTLRMIVP